MLNASTTRETKAAELSERIDRYHRWSEGFDVLADALEAIALPLVDLEDVRRHVVDRLRHDGHRSRLEADRCVERLRSIAASVAASNQWNRSH